MMKTASIATNQFPVQHSVRPDVNREFLEFDIDNGWDDVKKVHKKVLLVDNKKFTFCGWNSDTNKCYFSKPIDKEPTIAKIL